MIFSLDEHHHLVDLWWWKGGWGKPMSRWERDGGDGSRPSLSQSEWVPPTQFLTDTYHSHTHKSFGECLTTPLPGDDGAHRRASRARIMALEWLVGWLVRRSVGGPTSFDWNVICVCLCGLKKKGDENRFKSQTPRKSRGRLEEEWMVTLWLEPPWPAAPPLEPSESGFEWKHAWNRKLDWNFGGPKCQVVSIFQNIIHSLSHITMITTRPANLIKYHVSRRRRGTHP